MDVGARLRLIRMAKGLSQRELAKRAGVTNSAISMIEKNTVSPSINSLTKVLMGVPMSLVEFFDEKSPPALAYPVVYRQRDLLDVGMGAVEMKLVGKSFCRARSMDCLINYYPPGKDSGEAPLLCKGEVVGYVLSGELELTVDNHFFQVKAGDSFYFETHLPHRFHNKQHVGCEFISVNTPVSL